MFIPLALVYTISACLAAINQVNSAVEDKFSCPHGWTRYGNKKCLKYVNELQDYERAGAACRSKNQGSLVTIHSHDEQNFVYSYIHSIAASSTPIWLGAKQMDFESILWLDKTENSYVNWAPSEPSHPDEICIAINPRNGQWHDVMCTEANVPACERAPTTQWPFFVAFCSEGWFQFNDEKCVRIISSQALNFYESQELCRSKYNSKLLSIKSDKESEFIHNLIKFRDLKLPVWLGAVQNDFSSFNWIDKSDVTFTNWADGEPNDPDHACISMTALGGKWSDNDCKEQKLILCQKLPEDGSCETGWLQFRQDQCYRFVHFRLTYDDGESLCNNLYGGHLPSIHSQEEQFMVTQFLASVNVKNGSEIWLGGRQMDFHNFNWADGSMFNYSYWEHGQPNFPAEKCIEMSWRNGRWNDINCRLKRAVLCERPVITRNLIKPNLYLTNCLANLSNCNNNSSPTTSGSTTTALVVNGLASSSTSITNNGTTLANNAVVDPLAGQLDQQHQQQQLSPSSPLEATSTFQVDQQSNNNKSSSADGGTATNDPSQLMMLPPDDRPIKVITSIMHREHQSTAGGGVGGGASASLADQPSSLIANSTSPNQAGGEQHPQSTAENATAIRTATTATATAAAATTTTTTTSSTSFIHYNLPPPDPATFTQPQQQEAATKTTSASANAELGGQFELVAKKEQPQGVNESPTTVATTITANSVVTKEASQPKATESVNQIQTSQLSSTSLQPPTAPSTSLSSSSSSSSSSLLEKIIAANNKPSTPSAPDSASNGDSSAASKLNNQDFDQFVGVNKDEHLVDNQQQLDQQRQQSTKIQSIHNNDNKSQPQEASQVQTQAADNISQSVSAVRPDQKSA